MNNYTILDLNNSTKPKVYKQLWTIKDEHSVVLGKSINQKLGITEDSTVFLKQQITHDSTILMKIKEFKKSARKMSTEKKDLEFTDLHENKSKRIQGI